MKRFAVITVIETIVLRLWCRVAGHSRKAMPTFHSRPGSFAWVVLRFNCERCGLWLGPEPGPGEQETARVAPLKSLAESPTECDHL